MISRLNTAILAAAALAALISLAAPAAAQTLPGISSQTGASAKSGSDKQVVLRGLVFTVSEGRRAELERRYPGLLGKSVLAPQTSINPEATVRFADLLREAERKGLVRIESRPTGIVRDGELLHLSAGVQVGVLAKGVKPPPDGSSIHSVLDASKTFDIRPRVEQQPGGGAPLVSMEINLEINYLVPGKGKGDDALPSVQRQSISTTVSARDGETLVLGGMLDESAKRRTYFALSGQVVSADAPPAGGR